MADEGELSGVSEACRVSGYRKQSRENTVEEKRHMRNNRKRRKRRRSTGRIAALKAAAEVESEQHRREESEKNVIHYKMMARSYWERWRWELHQRKEVMQRNKGSTRVSRVLHLLEIDETLLLDPVNGESEVYVGQGSFAVVKMKVFRGITVAVKDLQPLTILSDIKKEATVLSKLCHPFLPYLFGICTAKQPYKIVIQFHGIDNSTKTLTISKAIIEKKIKHSHVWLGVCLQLMEALCYIHAEVQILHNDIKQNNVLLTDSMTASQLQTHEAYHIVLIDFGKATALQNDHRYNHSDAEKAAYFSKYPHIPPEVIEGQTPRTEASDVYAAGCIMQQVMDSDLLIELLPEQKLNIQYIINKCKHLQYMKRPTAKETLELFRNIL